MSWPVTRRELRVGSGTVLVTGSGCLGKHQTPQLRLRNLGTTRHSMTAEITRVATGETVLARHVSLGAKTVDETVQSVFPSAGQYDVCVTPDWGVDPV